MGRCAFLIPVDNELSGAQLMSIRILYYTIILESSRLSNIDFIIVNLSRSINSILRQELLKLANTLHNFGFNIYAVNFYGFKRLTGWFLESVSLSLSSQLNYDKILILSGDVPDYTVYLVLAKFFRKHESIGIFIGNIVTGTIPHAIYLKPSLGSIIKYLSGVKGITKPLKLMLLFVDRCTRLYDVIITPGRALYDILIRIPLSKNILSFEHPSIPFAFSVLNMPLSELIKSKRRQTLTIAFISRYTVGKGLYTIIRLIEHFTYTRDDIKFLIIGVDHKYVPHRLLKLHNVEVTGAVNPYEVPTLLSRCHVLIYPSLVDTYAHVIPESLASATPAITYDVEPYRSNFGDCTAVIRVPLKGGFRGIVNVIETLLEDSSSLYKLQCVAYEYAYKSFAPSNVVKEFMEILRRSEFIE